MNVNAKLSQSETRVAELLAWGADKKQIADILSVSINTVTTHSRHIFEKIGIQKATELSAWWFCTHYNISFDLSPLLRRYIAIALLCISGVSIIADTSEFLRCARTSRTITARARKSRKETETTFDNFLLNA